MKNKKIFYKLILLIIIVLITIFVVFNHEQINNIFIDKKKEEINKNITFQVYSNENDILKILVTAKDIENGINKLIYLTEEGQQKEINCYGKTQVTVDYFVKQNGEYEFKIINQNNQEIIETLVVDDNYRSNIIGIAVSTEKNVDTQGNVTIEYPENQNATKMYKIGENGIWTEYTGKFEINSYDVIEKNLQNASTKKVNIYAKLEDKANNVVQVKKEIDNIDVDMPTEPQINILSVDEYPILTTEGMINNSKLSIKYDIRDDITNYYSIDNGMTWIKYDDELSFNNVATIIGKSVKNESGLEISKKEFINASASDALEAKAYDNDETTSISGNVIWSWGNGQTIQNFLIDNSMYEKNIKFIGNAGYHYDGPYLHIFFYDNEENQLAQYSYRGEINLNQNIECPKNSIKVKVLLTVNEYVPFQLKEVCVGDN